MRTQQIVIATLTAGTIVVAGAGAAMAEPSASRIHTLKFVSKQTSTTQFGPRFVSADTDLRGSHVIGNDVLSAKVTYTKKVHKIAGSIAIALRNGEIYARVVGDPDTNKLSGTLIGGTGSYHGISGTIKGAAVKGSPSEERLVVRYR